MGGTARLLMQEISPNLYITLVPGESEPTLREPTLHVSQFVPASERNPHVILQRTREMKNHERRDIPMNESVKASCRD
jgi:hypothetical protein